jgi:hypothetical protein
MKWEDKQALKEKVQVGGISAVAGALVWWFVLAHGFGWENASTAKEQADTAAKNAVAVAIAPLCADQLMANKDVLAKYQKAEGYDQDTIVQDTVKKIGSVTLDYNNADACVNAINARLKAASEKTSSPSKG